MRIKSTIFALVFCATTIGAPFSGFISYAEEANNAQTTQTNQTSVATGVAPNGVSIEGHDISGMDQSQASQVVSDILAAYRDKNFTLIADGEEMKAKGSDLNIIPVNEDVAKKAVSYGSTGNILERFVNLKDLEEGRKKDFTLSLTSDWNKTKEFLEENTAHLESAPVNNTLVRENGAFRIIEGKSGIVIDNENSAISIADYITTQWDGEDCSIELAVTRQEPKGSKEELSAVKDLLGTCSTDFSSSSHARASNVKNGTSKLNGKLIYPGEEFSVSTNLESRNAANGYLPAPSYENGTTVDTYGGGVCQISTTLYNAVIRSELEVVTRFPHSMVVSYVKPSMDAAISEGSKDFVFKNNKEYPVYIEGYTSGGMLYFNIFGKEDRAKNRSVTFESEVVSRNDPGEKYVAKADLPVGKIVREQSAHVGYQAKLWKIVTENGKEVSRKVFNESAYRASPAIYSVGTATDNPAAQSAIASAISTQNKDNIRGVAASLAEGNIPAGSTAPGTVTPTPAPAPVVTPTPSPTPAPDPVISVAPEYEYPPEE